MELSLAHLKDPNFGKPPKTANKNVLRLSAPHIDSFNFIIDQGLQEMRESIPSVEFFTKSGDRVTLSVNDLSIEKPSLPMGSSSESLSLYPRECIERGCSYKSAMMCEISWYINYIGDIQRVEFGDLPIMVKSAKCHLSQLGPAALVKRGELANETGGYFIINGIRKVLRMLVTNRRNYPIAMTRKTWKHRDSGFSDKGIQIRCVSKDETSSVNVLHFLLNGDVKLSIQIGKQILFLPAILCLKILYDACDYYIYKEVMKGRDSDTYLSDKLKMMLRDLHNKDILDQISAKKFIGKLFRTRIYHMHIGHTDEQVCDYIFSNHVFIHLSNDKSKFQLLCSMLRKMYSYAQSECSGESVDATSLQEVQLGSFTLLQYIKEKLFSYLNTIKLHILKLDSNNEQFEVTDKVLKNAIPRGIKMGNSLITFIATGSLVSQSGLGLMQDAGLSVMMENLNRLRDLSHLRAIHRGTYFLDMKTVMPRRLTGEAWGFLCPVHTPDGAPCGLLNHLTNECYIPCNHCDSKCISKLTLALAQLGMSYNYFEGSFEVQLDGECVGFISEKEVFDFATMLRQLKARKEIYMYTEIVVIPRRQYGGQYPGLYLFTSPSRMMRPVFNISAGETEYVGTFEQLYLNVAVSEDDVQQGVHTHIELDKTQILSNIGKLVPFSDCNPNPRNMYQCQMSKQTMGTPHHNFFHQTSAKTYRLQYPQVPLVRNAHYDDINLEEFCLGFNAVLAIVSYTGFDMEDAMVVNKCAMERGLGHGQIIKSEFVDLTQLSKQATNTIRYIFKRDPSREDLVDYLDDFGLPMPGVKLKESDPYYCYFDLYQDKYIVVKYKGEACIVDKYSIMGRDFQPTECQRVNISLTVRRDPIIGDKFASRSGQKGVLSTLYRTEDLPFSERGIVPDIIFNPHGIPSRMTAGKLLELICGKGAAEFGVSYDSTPFQFSDEDPAYEYFGQILEKAGFNYHGEDTLYSGTDGRMIETKIFEGIIYYQRLRHMTSDKWQVRSKGPMDPITHQPVKGRKRGGAIRFGEMERDCLISHGAAFLLKDRLLDCSDASYQMLCSKCGCLLSPTLSVPQKGGNAPKGLKCRVCEDSKVEKIQMSRAFKYLVTELASVGVKVKIGINYT